METNTNAIGLLLHEHWAQIRKPAGVGQGESKRREQRKDHRVHGMHGRGGLGWKILVYRCLSVVEKFSPLVSLTRYESFKIPLAPRAAGAKLITALTSTWRGGISFLAIKTDET
jgi:hypothetical protein